MGFPSFAHLTLFYEHSGWTTMQGPTRSRGLHSGVQISYRSRKLPMIYLKNKQFVSALFNPKLREYKVVSNDYEGFEVGIVFGFFCVSTGSTPFKGLRAWFPHLTKWRQHRDLRRKQKCPHISYAMQLPSCGTFSKFSILLLVQCCCEVTDNSGTSRMGITFST